MKNCKISVLGTPYTVRFCGELSEPRLRGASGDINSNIKDIVVDDLSDYSTRYYNVPAEGHEEWTKLVARHEIIHAFLYESGIRDHDEKMVDWVAMMLPKMYETCFKAGCI